MLVVVSIMMLLLAAAATRMKPANESRRIRESARAVSIYLSTARNRAMETGRPCGVILHRFGGATSAVMSLDQCEVPPPYAGDTTNATMQVTVSGNTVTTTTTSGFTNTLVANGDLIQFNGQGPYYTITDRTGGGAGGTGVIATFDASQGQLVPWTSSSPAVSYRIYRLPSSTSATTFKGQAQSLQLPASTVIDLDGSGIDGATPFGGGNDVGILFSSNGSVYGWYTAGSGVNAATVPIYLLVGKRERVGATPVATDPATWSNWQDLTNLWVVINPQTGLVTSGEMAAVPIWDTNSTYAVGNYVLESSTSSNVYVSLQGSNKGNSPTATGSTYWTKINGTAPLPAVTAARVLARDAQSMGGK